MKKINKFLKVPPNISKFGVTRRKGYRKTNCYFLRYPLRRRRLILGRTVESHTAIENFFKIFAF